MNRWIVCLSIAILCASPQAFSQSPPEKVAIIKADDVWNKTANWNRFFALSREKGVKVSAGIICNSLAGDRKDYLDWLRSLHASGWVEFWNHGWDHGRWMTDTGEKVSEFGGTGYEHQKNHFDDSQRIMKSVFGMKPVAFGPPYNAFDANTVKVMNEDAGMRLFFCYGVVGFEGKMLARMHLRGEHDGTGKPNFKKFKAAYLEKKDVSVSAIQVHPNSFGEEHFAEYAKILDFLKAEGWTFMQPTEYVSNFAKTND